MSSPRGANQRSAEYKLWQCGPEAGWPRDGRNLSPHLSPAAEYRGTKGRYRSLLWDTRASIDAVLAIAPYNRRLTTQSFNLECADRRRQQKMAPRSGRALIDKFLRRAGPLLGGFRGAAAGPMKIVP